jgi:glycosyltransferase involved in cell wall biosynthesis
MLKYRQILCTIWVRKIMATPLNVLWLIDHVCFDGSLHAGGRLYMNVFPRVDPDRVRIHPYFLNASDAVTKAFDQVKHPVVNLALSKYDVFSRRHKVDVMHLFCFGASAFGRVASLWNRKPSVIHEFDTPTYGPYPTAFKIADRLLAGRTNFALAASTHCRDFVHEQRFVPLDKIEVLYHAVPEEKFATARTMTREGARRELGWDADRFVFLTVTKLGPDRGNETLLQAFAEVRKQIPKARLAMVYRPTLYHRVPLKYKDIPWVTDAAAMRQRIEDMIDKLGLRGSAELIEMEAPERHEPYYAASDVLVLPFESPLFSSVNMIESMVYGLPHVVTDLGEPADIVNRWGGGVKVPPNAAPSLAQAMINIATDPGMRQALAQKARTAALDFGCEAVAERLTRLYLRMAERQDTAPQRVTATG